VPKFSGEKSGGELLIKTPERFIKRSKIENN
jgi:hypothetical protein